MKASDARVALRAELGISTDHRVARERFLVTGSEGCIGAWTVRNLIAAGFATVALDLEPTGRRLAKILNPDPSHNLNHVAGDLRDSELVERVVNEHQITRIVHLAALQVPFVAADPVLGGEVNVVGTIRVFEAVRRANGLVRGMSYASSAAAIGPSAAPHEPETLYGAYKMCNEHSARIYARDYATPSIGLRPCIVYGPARDQGMTAALTHAMKAAVLGIPFRIPFGGQIDAQYAQDVASAFIRCALVDGVEGAPVYDLHGDAVTVADFVDLIRSECPDAEITHEDKPIPGNVTVDDTDLIEMLGGLPKTSLAVGVHRSIETFGELARAGKLSADELP